MINSVSGATHPQAAAHAAAAAQQPTPSKPQPAPTDTVQLSIAAQAFKEAIENPAQTAREAAGGDLQAKRLLSKEAADKAV
jgi:hypothetical protein